MSVDMGNNDLAPEQRVFELGTAKPGELLAVLISGQPCSIEGYSLTPGEHSVWITSPYGVDTNLWQDLSIERIEQLIDTIAKEVKD